MRPTSPELIDAIVDALEKRVLPAVTDKWAASTVRSAMQLLRHLAVRVELEPRLVPELDAELATELERVRDGLSDARLADLRNRVDAALALPEPAAGDVAARDARFEQRRAAAESVIAARDRVRECTGSSALHDSLVDCLLRQLDRERALIAPFQSTPPI